MGKRMDHIDDLSENLHDSDSKMNQNEDIGVYFIKNKCTQVHKRIRKFLHDAKIYHRIDAVMRFMLSNPILLVGFIIVTAILVIPIMLFTTFAIINVAVAFSGFIIVEVMLLLIGMTVLCCIMFLIVSAVVGAGVTIVISFYITYFLASLIKKNVPGRQ